MGNQHSVDVADLQTELKIEKEKFRCLEEHMHDSREMHMEILRTLANRENQNYAHRRRYQEECKEQEDDVRSTISETLQFKQKEAWRADRIRELEEQFAASQITQECLEENRLMIEKQMNDYKIQLGETKLKGKAN